MSHHRTMGVITWGGRTPGEAPPKPEQHRRRKQQKPGGRHPGH